jgi:hypothetical protein
VAQPREVTAGLHTGSEDCEDGGFAAREELRRNAKAAVVRISVMRRPSITASGPPVSGLNSTITAWCVWMPWFCG